MKDSREPREVPSLVQNLVLLAAEHAVVIGLSLRLLLGWLLPLLLPDDGSSALLPGVAYTDIDYHVFSDAAEHIRNGGSPYDRHTYRYTPFLAALLAALPRGNSGRYLFCFADALSGWIILRFRQNQRSQQPESATGKARDLSWRSLLTPELQDALWWLYNPLAINICTRGSAESLVVLLPVLVTVWLVLYTQTIMQQSSRGNTFKTVAIATLAGVWHGIAIHAKLYPIIYTLSFATALTTRATNDRSQKTAFLSYLLTWVRRLLSVTPIVFCIVSAATFLALTYLAILWYGDQALEEGLLYHFSRVDHRHNYSMHWYWIYLARGAAESTLTASANPGMAIVGRLLLLPQLVLLVYTSLEIAPKNLSLALFVQTFLFVAHNKVITAQYFTWYLCLLPLCSHCFSATKRVGAALALLLASIVFWLLSAYCLEMQGLAVHRVVWMASVLFFAANVNLLGALLASYVPSGGKESEANKKKQQ